MRQGVDILCQHEASKAAFAIDLKITEENLFEAFTKIAKSIDKTMKDKGLTTVQYPSDGNSRSLVPRVVVGAGVHGVRGFLQAWKENARTLKTGVHPLGFVQHPAMKMMLLQIKEQLDLQKQLAEKRVYTQAVEAISATKAALSNAMPVSKSEFVENPEAGGKIPLDTLMGLDHVSKTIKEQAAFTLRDGLGS